MLRTRPGAEGLMTTQAAGFAHHRLQRAGGPDDRLKLTNQRRTTVRELNKDDLACIAGGFQQNSSEEVDEIVVTGTRPTYGYGPSSPGGVYVSSGYTGGTSTTGSTTGGSDSDSDDGDEGEEHEDCQTVTAPDGSTYQIPNGYSVVGSPGGIPGAFMQAPDGSLHVTPWWAEQSGQMREDYDRSYSELSWYANGVIFIAGAPFWASGAAAGTLIWGTGGGIWGLNPPAVQPPGSPNLPC